jgi:hypothetical protein
VLFSADAHPGLRSGDITLTFRAWKRPQAKAGGHHKVHGVGVLAIDDVGVVPVDDITDEDARRSGHADRAALLARFPKAGEVYRISFHLLEDGPPEPFPDDEVRRRLARLPWASDVLRLIRDHPGTVSTVLAAEMGRERMAFKADVRKLKALGLTESLEVGYRLTPLGERIIAGLP